ncbi:transposase [Pusillimonas sp. TS35]|nr:transposase [Pusillimonas sp. TS35]
MGGKANQLWAGNGAGGVYGLGCQQKGIAIRYIQPGKPNQNAFIERFNRT